MLNQYKISSIILLILVIASSCNIKNGIIQKRKYRKGYHVSINHKIKNVVADNQSSISPSKKPQIKPVSEKKDIQDVIVVEEKHKALLAVENSEISNAEPKLKKSFLLKANEQKPSGNIKKRVRNLSASIKARKNIASKPIYASDVITVVVVILALVGAILAFQLIDGALGVMIGLALILGIIIVLITLPFW